MKFYVRSISVGLGILFAALSWSLVTLVIAFNGGENLPPPLTEPRSYFDQEIAIRDAENREFLERLKAENKERAKKPFAFKGDSINAYIIWLVLLTTFSAVVAAIMSRYKVAGNLWRYYIFGVIFSSSVIVGVGLFDRL
jgi:hypothetical protein